MNARRGLMLLWREAEETRWALYAGVGAFVVLPLFAVVLSVGGAYLRLTVLGFGGLLAVLIATASTTRDLRGGVAMFWRSRPIGVGGWLAAKYLVGLLVVMIVHALALTAQVGVELYLFRYPALTAPAVATLVYHSLTLVLIYSAGFFLGCLVRRPVQAALLALAAVLAIYCLPLLVPPLNFLSVHELIRVSAAATRNAEGHKPGEVRLPHFHPAPGTATFAAALLTASALCAAGAAAAVRREWRVRMDVRLMAWTLGGVALLVFTAGAAQLGSNLRAERIVRLDSTRLGRQPRAWIRQAVFSGSRRGWISVPPIQRSLADAYRLQPVDLDAPDPLAGAPLEFPGVDPWQRVQWDPARPQWLFCLQAQVPPGGANRAPGEERTFLLAMRIDGSGPCRVEIPMPPQEVGWVTAKLLGVCSGHAFVRVDANKWGQFANPSGGVWLVALDVSDPASPRVESNQSLTGHGPWAVPGSISSGELVVPLPPLPGVDPRGRLEVTLGGRLEGEIAVTGDEAGDILVWRLIRLEEHTARFTLAGTGEPTPLERVLPHGPEEGLELWSSRPALLHGGYFYTVSRGRRAGIEAYDLTDPANPRRVGHYAAPGEEFSALEGLPRGRVLATGYALHAVAPPGR